MRVVLDACRPVRTRGRKHMDVSEIIEQLEFNTGRFPREAVEAARQQPEAVIPELLRAVEDAAANPEEAIEKDAYFLPLYAMYLLAEFREVRAYAPIIKIASLPGEGPHEMLGEVVTEDLHRMLAAVCGGDTGPIERLVTDSQASEYPRGAAMQALVTLVACGEKPREEVVAFFTTLFEGGLGEAPVTVWSSLINCCTDIYPEEFYTHIERAYAEGRVDLFWIRIEDVKHTLERTKEAVLAELPRRNRGLILNTVDELHWWACFKDDEPAPKEHVGNQFPEPFRGSEPAAEALQKRARAGRNAPCPCGSGKKYKTCCLGRT